MTEVHSIRCSMTRDFLAVIQSEWPEKSLDIWEGLSPSTRQAIELTTRVGWLELEHHCNLNEAALSLLGLDAYQEGWHKAVLKTVEQPTLKSVVEGAFRLFGISPASIIRIMPRVWGLLFKNGGNLEADADKASKTGSLALDGFPAEHFMSSSFALGLVGCFRSFYNLTRSSGTVELTDIHSEKGYALYAFRWR